MFLVFTWFGGYIAIKCKLSPIIGEVAMGVIFGPPGLNIVPYTDDLTYEVILDHADDSHRRFMSSSDGSHLSIWQLAGSVGVALMIAESGMHLDFDKVPEVGSKAFCVAILGTFMPIGLGMACIAIFASGSDQLDTYPDGFAVGACLGAKSHCNIFKLIFIY